MEESEILQNAMKSFEVALEFFAICTYDSISPYRLDDIAAGVFVSYLVISTNKNLFQFSG